MVVDIIGSVFLTIFLYLPNVAGFLLIVFANLPILWTLANSNQLIISYQYQLLKFQEVKSQKAVPVL